MAVLRDGLTSDHLALALLTPGIGGHRGLNLMLWGATGGGKSSLAKATARQYGLDCVELILGLVEPEDVAGLPVPGLSGSFRRQVDPRLEAAAERGHVLLFDDFTAASPAVQAATLRLILEREVAGLDLSGTPMLATANPRRGGGLYPVLAPAANRFLHLRMDARNVRLHLEHGYPQDAAGRPLVSSVLESDLARGWQAALERAWATYRRFLASAPAELVASAPPVRIEGPEEAAYPTPRSWEMAVRATAAAWATGIDPRPLVEGCVGAAAAAAALEAPSLGRRVLARARPGSEPQAQPSPEPAAIDYLAVCAAAPGIDGATGLPVVAWGGVGTGKSSAARAALEAIGRQVRTIVLGSWMPTDLGGIPIPGDGASYRRQVDPALAQASGPGWGLVLDDLTFAAPATQNAALDLVLRRRAGAVDLRSTPILVTANPSGAGAAHGLTLPLANRMLHLPFGRSPGRRWLLGTEASRPMVARLDRLRSRFDEELARAQVAVEGYLRARPGDLEREPATEHPEGGYDHAFPTPRSWELAARALAACRAAGVPPLPLLSAALGEEVGALFAQWDVDHPLPSPSDVYAGAVDWSCLRPDEALAAAKAAALYASEDGQVDALLREGRRCREQNAADIFAVALRVLRQRMLVGELPLARARDLAGAGRELADAAGVR